MSLLRLFSSSLLWIMSSTSEGRAWKISSSISLAVSSSKSLGLIICLVSNGLAPRLHDHLIMRTPPEWSGSFPLSEMTLSQASVMLSVLRRNTILDSIPGQVIQEWIRPWRVGQYSSLFTCITQGITQGSRETYWTISAASS
jgi:hypothetical protein